MAYICAHCGKKIKEIDQSVRCPYCGYRVLVKARPNIPRDVKTD